MKQKRYAKLIDINTKKVSVGLGTNESFYKSIGYVEMEVEKGYEGNWYLAGHAPSQSLEEKNAEVELIRKDAYIRELDCLTMRKIRKCILNEWTDTDETQYNLEVKIKQKNIEDRYPYYTEA